MSRAAQALSRPLGRVVSASPPTVATTRPATVLAHAAFAARPTPVVGGGTRCPIDADFIKGGVSADAGKLAVLDAVHDGRWVLALAADGRCATARIDGAITLTDDGTDVARVGTDGRLVLTDVVDGHTRRAEVDAASVAHASEPGLYVIDGNILLNAPADTGETHLIRSYQNVGNLGSFETPRPETRLSGSPEEPIVRRYSVDGVEQPWEAGRGWFATAMSQLIRETAYDVHDREVRMRARGGVAAVLTEIRRLYSNDAKVAYFKTLVDTGPLSADERRETIDAVQSTLPPSPDRDTIVAHVRSTGSDGAAGGRPEGTGFHLGNVF